MYTIYSLSNISFHMGIHVYYLLAFEHILAYSTDRAKPIFRHISPGSSRSYSVIWISLRRIIYVTADRATILFHVVPSCQ
jgi:hypothetical protein